MAFLANTQDGDVCGGQAGQDYCFCTDMAKMTILVSDFGREIIKWHVLMFSETVILQQA